jgi:hypothetical protein
VHCNIVAAPLQSQVLHERKPLVLASDEDGGTHTLKFSLASDIVDEEFTVSETG